MLWCVSDDVMNVKNQGKVQYNCTQGPKWTNLAMANKLNEVTWTAILLETVAWFKSNCKSNNFKLLDVSDEIQDINSVRKHEKSCVTSYNIYLSGQFIKSKKLMGVNAGMSTGCHYVYLCSVLKHSSYFIYFNI